MKRLQPVIWSKGTFLTPQHLQIQDRYIESSLQFRLEALNFRPWGFQTIRIDQEALAGGNLAIAAASGIFPDGLLFDMPGTDNAPTPKPLVNCFEADQDSLDIYLGIPEYREKGMNVANPRSGVDARYVADILFLRDENTGLAEKPVQIATKNIRLLSAGELPEGTTALCAAKVRRSAAGVYSLDPRFVPPLLDFHASDYLVSIARRQIEILSARSSQLAGTRRQRNQSLADFSASDVANFWLLYTINSHFPLLNHLFETKRSHPERYFAAALELAGALTTFSTEMHPRDLPKYDHNNLTFCFSDLDEKLRKLLETVIPTNCISLPLKLIQPSIYGTALADDRYLKNTRMYLAMSAELPKLDLVAKTPGLVKVCSASHVEHLVRQALPGVPLTHLQAPPNSIPIKTNYEYFSLSQSGIAWEAIGRARNLAAYVPSEIPNPEMELVILLPDA